MRIAICSCVHHTGMLEGALRSSNAQYDPSDILERIGVRLLESTPGDTGWEVFSLDYKIDMPINAVVSSPSHRLL